MQVITTTDALAAFSKDLADGAFFAVDTEFMRERTYWPRLCLVQAAAENGEAAIIDPLSKDIDLAPFLEAMRAPETVKVFHAARQDVEIFCKLLGAPPTPLFDTQVAAMACGFGDQIGYEPLMRQLLGAKIDKGSRFTDWSRRPLSDTQLAYALSDVTHLRAAYPILKEKLSNGRGEWVAEEMAALADPALYDNDPDQAWRRLKLRNVRPKELGVLMKVTAWREREAQARDIPRGRVLKDEAIHEIARHPPKSEDDLGRMRGLPNGYERSKPAQALLAAVAEGLETPKEDLPRLNRVEDKGPAPADVVELLRVLLKRQCEHHDVAPKLIASAADLDDIARCDDADVPALRGWRRKVFGEAALRLKRGELGLKLEDGEVKLFETA